VKLHSPPLRGIIPDVVCDAYARTRREGSKAPSVMLDIITRSDHVTGIIRADSSSRRTPGRPRRARTFREVPLAAFVTLGYDFLFPFFPAERSRSERKQERTLGRSVNVLSSPTSGLGLARASACFDASRKRTARFSNRLQACFRAFGHERSSMTIIDAFLTRASATMRLISSVWRRPSQECGGIPRTSLYFPISLACDPT